MKRIALLFLLTLLALPVSAQDRTSAVGRVLSSEGETEIVSPDGQVSKAIRSKFILEGDTLATGADGFLQVDDMNQVALAVDVRLHLRIPPTGTVAEVHASLEQLAHGKFGQCHEHAPLPVVPPQGVEAGLPPPDGTLGLNAGAPALRVNLRRGIPNAPRI